MNNRSKAISAYGARDITREEILIYILDLVDDQRYAQEAS